MGKTEQKTIEVIATSRGHYGGMVREAGERFTITADTKIGSWMSAVVKPAQEQEPKPAPEPTKAPAGKPDDI